MDDVWTASGPTLSASSEAASSQEAASLRGIAELPWAFFARYIAASACPNRSTCPMPSFGYTVTPMARRFAWHKTRSVRRTYEFQVISRSGRSNSAAPKVGASAWSARNGLELWSPRKLRNRRPQQIRVRAHRSWPRASIPIDAGVLRRTEFPPAAVCSALGRNTANVAAGIGKS